MSASERIFLVGLMGAGKTTVGRKLAQCLQYDFVDTDKLLEHRTGVTVRHIFDLEGEQGFRDREANILAEISAWHQVVIATGGGIVERQENRRILRSSGTVVYLNADLELLWQRLENCHDRPLISRPNPRQTLAALLLKRAPLYADVADIDYRVGAGSPARAATAIHARLCHDSG